MLVPQQAADDVDDVVADNVPADDVADVVVDDVIADVVAHVGTAQRVESSTDTVLDNQEDASKQGGIIAKIDVDKDVIMEEVDATKGVEVEKNADVQGRLEEYQAQVYHIDLEHADKVLSIQDDEPEPAELKEVIKLVTTAKLMTEVVTAPATTVASTITAAPSAARRRKWESRALKRQSKSSKEKAVKKQKLDEEVEELKKHLQIVPNNDDDIYTEATPLALKVPVVDYEIYIENNKPYYKIIRADGTHQLFLSFLSLLRNFDREDLEVLWQIVKERFASSKPKSFLDEFLLTTLKVMFEKPNVEVLFWKNQRGVHDDLAGREKISIDKIHFVLDAEQSLELMLLKTSRIYSKGLLLLVKDLLLLVQVKAIG
nr:hypothetical protein [Tanacetum cinerariifolium]